MVQYPHESLLKFSTVDIAVNMIQNVVENRVLRTRIFYVLSIPSRWFSDAVWLCHRHILLRHLYFTSSPLAAILAIHPFLRSLL